MEVFETVVVEKPAPVTPVVAPPLLLTRRERQIIELVVGGKSNEEIASTLGTSNQTIKNQLTVIFSKVQVRTRVQLAVYALRRGLVA